MPASLAISTSSPWMVEVTTRRSVKYFARNWSPWLRAVSTFSTNFLFLETCFCNCASCCWRTLRSRRRSSAPPPNGLNAITAATRLASRRTPRTARMATRGSFHLSAERLKFLSIIHRKAIAVQRLGLGRRLINILGDAAEQVRTLQRFVEQDHRLGTLRAYLQAQGDLIASGHVGLNIQHLDVGRHGFFQIRENARPTDAFAAEQGIEEDAEFQHLGVLGFADYGLEIGLLFAGGGDLGAQSGDFLAHVGHLRAVGVGERDQGRERGHQQGADRDRGHQHGAVAPEGLASEIDGNLHFNWVNYFWRWTADTPAVPRYSPPGRRAASAEVPLPRLTPRRSGSPLRR